jgi:hypothetical protein
LTDLHLVCLCIRPKPPGHIHRILNDTLLPRLRRSVLQYSRCTIGMVDGLLLSSGHESGEDIDLVLEVVDLLLMHFSEVER